ncbi:MAG: bifunctional nicotinamidase/pyrazinamidase [Planctomycetota bacterium]
MKTALILVDLQNDFLPGGALAVPHGDEVVAVANRLMPRADVVVATQDWHPPQHGSFAAEHPGRKPFEMGELNGLAQVLWPVHCVEWTGGAQFAPGLETRRLARCFPKGTDPGIDSYSGFFDNGRRKATALADWLKAQTVGAVWILGLATDYCVKATALDAHELGFRTTLIEDGCRAVNLQPADGPRTIAELRAAGIAVLRSTELGRI